MNQRAGHKNTDDSADRSTVKDQRSISLLLVDDVVVAGSVEEVDSRRKRLLTFLLFGQI